MLIYKFSQKGSYRNRSKKSEGFENHKTTIDTLQMYISQRLVEERDLKIKERNLESVNELEAIHIGKISKMISWRMNINKLKKVT